GGDHGGGQLGEGCAAAGTAVEGAAAVRVPEEPADDLDDVVDVDEVAPVHAGLRPGAGAEDARHARGRDLVVELEGHARHRALVALAGAVGVEVAETHHLGGAPG